jgi:ABC-type sugar transport system ATPase subunit
MRDGRVIAEAPVESMTRARVVQLMVGDQLARDAAAVSSATRHPRGSGEVRLRARGLAQRGVFRDIDLDVHAGEILCLTGLIGSKRTELMHCLFGSARFDAGTLEVEGKAVAFTHPRRAMAAGVGFVPEDRHREGLMLGLSVSDNLLMTTLRRVCRAGWLNRRKVAEHTRDSIQRLNVQPPDGRKLVRQLSGGNQQKVLLGKWFRLGPRVILLDEPTVGVDVGAKAEIYALLRAQRDAGAAVLVVSSDLEEVMAIADRIAVMVAGRLVAVHDAGDVTMAQIAAEIGGAAT